MTPLHDRSHPMPEARVRSVPFRHTDLFCEPAYLDGQPYANPDDLEDEHEGGGE